MASTKPDHIRVLVKYTRLIAVFIFLCSIVGFFEHFVPLADLFNHFRLQAVAGLFVCLVGMSLFKDVKGIAFCTLALLLNIGLVALMLYKTAGISGLGNVKPKFSIISSNVLTSNARYDDVIKLVNAQRPDFILFTEVNNEWVKRLRPLEKTYKYKYALPSEDNFGIAAYSLHPFEGKVKYSGGAALPIVISQVDEGITIIGVHPLPPASEWNITEQRMYLADVAKIVSDLRNPVIVTGDFNTTLWSAGLKPLLEVGLKRINPLGIAYTWPTSDIFFAVQIDHFFGKNIKAADFKVLPPVGSDHFPIRADLAY